MSGSASGRDRELIQRLMMRALDEELGADERRELERALNESSELRAEWDRLRRLKEVTSQMKLRRPPEEIWDAYWASVYRRVERGVGWILTSLGAIVLISYGAWQGIQELLADASLAWWIKAAILALTVGLVVLFVSVVREKLFVRRRDPYKDVQR